jgi:uncharacterized protein YfaQ (DUF2300 family)
MSTHVFVRCILQKSFASCARNLSLSCTVHGRRRRSPEYRVKGPQPDNVFAREEAETLDALEDFINSRGNVGHGQKLDLETEELVQKYGLNSYCHDIIN